MGLNPARVACEVFSTDTRKALCIQCYTHVGVRAKLNQLFGKFVHQNSIQKLYFLDLIAGSLLTQAERPSK